MSREWKTSKCSLFRLPFEKKLLQADYYVGKPLGSFIPLEQYPIERDGNCFFRAISAALTGSENHHEKIRGKVYRFIGVQGASDITRYLELKFSNLSSKQYLLQSQMGSDHI